MDESGVDEPSGLDDELGMLFAAEEAIEEEKEECVIDNEAFDDIPNMMESDNKCKEDKDVAEIQSPTRRHGRTFAQSTKAVKMGVTHMKHDHAQKTNTRRAYGPKWNQYLDSAEMFTPLVKVDGGGKA
jgi:NAD-dependent DNA ligase